jgi:hypothetical protein
LSLNPNGLEDHEIKIKGLDNIKVGDFSRKEADLENGLGSLTATDIATVKAIQVKLATMVVKAKGKKTAISNPLDPITEEIDPIIEDTDDEEEHEEVFTLGRMNTWSQTRVSWYFTTEEVEQETIRIAEEIAIDIDDDNDEDDAEPEYDPSSDDDNFDQALHSDLDATDENMK